MDEVKGWHCWAGRLVADSATASPPQMQRALAFSDLNPACFLVTPGLTSAGEVTTRVTVWALPGENGWSIPLEMRQLLSHVQRGKPSLEDTSSAPGLAAQVTALRPLASGDRVVDLRTGLVQTFQQIAQSSRELRRGFVQAAPDEGLFLLRQPQRLEYRESLPAASDAAVRRRRRRAVSLARIGYGMYYDEACGPWLRPVPHTDTVICRWKKPTHIAMAEKYILFGVPAFHEVQHELWPRMEGLRRLSEDPRRPPWPGSRCPAARRRRRGTSGPADAAPGA